MMGGDAGPMTGTGTLKRTIHVDAKLPALNWSALAANKVEGTVFGEIDDEDIINELDFEEFKEEFRIDVQKTGTTAVQQRPRQASVWTEARYRGPETVLDTTRARNLAILQRRIDSSAEQVIAAVKALDFHAIRSDKAELLRLEFIASDEERAILQSRHESGKKMADVDAFLYELSRVPRLKQRLSLLSHLDSCDEALKNIGPTANMLELASNSVLQSSRLKQVLKVILAYGNYMNSQRRGGAFGFKLSVVDRLMDTRSRDRSTSVLNFIVSSIEVKYPDALRFEEDLHGIDAASKLSLQSLEQDLLRLERTATAVLEELGHDATNQTLLTFRDKMMPKIDVARQEFNRAKACYTKTAKFFAEDANAEPSFFFVMFMRLVSAIRAASAENLRRIEAKKKLEEEERARIEAEEQRKQDMLSGKTLASSIKKKPTRKASVVDVKDEVEDGDIDSLISGLKEHGFRRQGLGQRRSSRSEPRQERRTQRANAYGAARPWLK